MAKKKMLGQVDLLGLNAFGQNPGMSPLIGLAIGGGATLLPSIVAQESGNATAQRYANLIGIGTGALATLAMWLKKGTRHAAFAAGGATILFTLRAIYQSMRGNSWLSMPQIEHLGLPQVHYLNGAGGGLGLPQVHYLNGAVGVPGLAPIPPAYGTIPGVANAAPTLTGFAGTHIGAHPPVDLLGEQSPQAQQVALMGGPVASGLANHYGANLFGGRN